MRFKSYTFSPKIALISLSVAALIALAISHWSGFPFWAAFLIVVGAMLVNGLIAQIEDDTPGGFNNPHPPKKPDDTKRDA